MLPGGLRPPLMQLRDNISTLLQGGRNRGWQECPWHPQFLSDYTPVRTLSISGLKSRVLKLLFLYELKVSKFRKQNTKFSHPPKNQRNFVHFFALDPKKWLKQKIKALENKELLFFVFASTISKD